MGYLKERIKHAVRFRHKRGFGVHSPFMFNLILNVIRDKEKQFTYPEMLEQADVLTQRERKVFRLLSRLIRYLNVKKIEFLGYNSDLLAEYLSLVYQDAVIQSNLPDQLKQADFVYIGRGADKTGTGEGMLSCLFNNERKCVVIADIYRSPWHRRIWRQYCEKATVSIDMMWYGIVLFDDKIQKGKYNLII